MHILDPTCYINIHRIHNIYCIYILYYIALHYFIYFPICLLSINRHNDTSRPNCLGGIEVYDEDSAMIHSSDSYLSLYQILIIYIGKCYLFKSFGKERCNMFTARHFTVLLASPSLMSSLYLLLKDPTLILELKIAIRKTE